MEVMEKNTNAFSVFKIVLASMIICAFPFLLIIGCEFFTVTRDAVREGTPLYIERTKIEFGPFKWLILYDSDDRKLLITEEIIAQLPYQTDFGVMYSTWEASTIRQFLNDSFLQEFTLSERNRIAETHVKNFDNLWFLNHGSTGGNDTIDMVFLLSLEEVDKYFGNSNDYLNKRSWSFHEGFFGRWTRLTDNNPNNIGRKLSNRYDVNRVAKYNGEPCLWWLRSPGGLPSFVAFVWSDGAVNVGGESFVSTLHSNCLRYLGVRPALWLYL